MSEKMTRRRMVQLSTLATGAVSIGGTAALTGCSTSKDDLVKPATVSAAEVPVGSGTVVEDTYVVAQPTAGKFHAYTAICPHQGCLVQQVTDTEIICPCHDSRFSTTTGEKLSGPASTGLAAAQVKQDGEQLTISMSGEG